jgi:hypothetical protein
MGEFVVHHVKNCELILNNGRYAMTALITNYRVISFHKSSFYKLICDMASKKLPKQLGLNINYFQVPFTMIMKIDREFIKFNNRGYIKLKIALKDVRKLTI